MKGLVFLMQGALTDRPSPENLRFRPGSGAVGRAMFGACENVTRVYASPRFRPLDKPPCLWWASNAVGGGGSGGRVWWVVVRGGVSSCGAAEPDPEGG